MHRNVEVLIGRLATDPGLQRRFARQPLDVIREQGLALTEIEIQAIAALSPAALRAFADRLDPRIRKAPLTTESWPDGE
jgi:hypothetical protein